MENKQNKKIKEEEEEEEEKQMKHEGKLLPIRSDCVAGRWLGLKPFDLSVANSLINTVTGCQLVSSTLAQRTQ